MNLEIVFSLSNQSPPTCLTSLECSAFFPLEMEFAYSLRQSKVNLKIWQYSYELLLQYLHKTQSITMLGVINEHINFQVSLGQPSSISDDEGVTLVRSGQDATNLINQKEIHWGQFASCGMQACEDCD
ncbi:hypothetical protein HYC85_027639 [Camellia sinensis]|uniref:TFIID subunit TAF5 NTD2 domain-containing protein n=1 Tax=Camellia sinensis TaxID=4442 RepID=A0A7J7G6W4_CAMSI|nr:hypothetical protein HYC85_027639 [Camellia sinensis]